MHSNNNHEDFQARAALYALGALSQSEAQTFADDLAIASDEARVEVAEFDAVVSQLGFSVAVASPPTDLRDKLMARIAAAAQPATKTSNALHAQHVDVFKDDGR